MQQHIKPRVGVEAAMVVLEWAQADCDKALMQTHDTEFALNYLRPVLPSPALADDFWNALAIRDMSERVPTVRAKLEAIKNALG